MIQNHNLVEMIQISPPQFIKSTSLFLMVPFIQLLTNCGFGRHPVTGHQWIETMAKFYVYIYIYYIIIHVYHLYIYTYVYIMCIYMCNYIYIYLYVMSLKIVKYVSCITVCLWAIEDISHLESTSQLFEWGSLGATKCYNIIKYQF